MNTIINWENVMNNVGKVYKTISYEDSEIKKAFVVNGNNAGFTFSDDDRPTLIIKSFITAVAYYLSKNKIVNEEKATACVLLDTSGVFKFAGYVEYFANTENPDEPGNWVLTFTFKESDLVELEGSKQVKRLLCTDQDFYSAYDVCSRSVGNIEFLQDRYMYDSAICVIETIKQVLDNNAIEDEEYTIEMPGFFTASVVVENEEKVFSIVPDGHIKAIIKDDSALDMTNY